MLGSEIGKGRQLLRFLSLQLNRFADCNVMNEFSNDPCPAPAVIDGSNRAMVSECTALKGFDYFTGSEVSYILTFVGIGLFAVGKDTSIHSSSPLSFIRALSDSFSPVPAGCVVILIICARRRQSNMKDQRRKQRAESNRNSTDPNMHIGMALPRLPPHLAALLLC